MTKHDILEVFKDIDFMYNDSSRLDTLSRMIDELQEEWEEKKRGWLKNIADNQIANAPTKGKYDFMPLEEHMKERYQRGVYDGLEMAFNIITERT